MTQISDPLTDTVSVLQFLVFGALAAFASGCSPQSETPKNNPVAQQAQTTEVSFTQEAQAALLPLKKNLMGTLRHAMETNGPVGALESCHLQAQPLTRAAQPGTMQIGRSSNRVRNPVNAAPDWLSPILQEYAASPLPLEAREVVLDDKRRAYIEPIYTQALCLNCHGKNLSPALQNKLSEKYPEDQATGYSEGDFRGVFWALAKDP